MNWVPITIPTETDPCRTFKYDDYSFLTHYPDINLPISIIPLRSIIESKGAIQEVSTEPLTKEDREELARIDNKSRIVHYDDPKLKPKPKRNPTPKRKPTNKVSKISKTLYFPEDVPTKCWACIHRQQEAYTGKMYETKSFIFCNIRAIMSNACKKNKEFKI